MKPHKQPNKSLGRVEWDDVVAELRSIDGWHVTNGGAPIPKLAKLLTNMYRGEFPGPSYGDRGAAILEDLARLMDGVATFYPPQPGPSGLNSCDAKIPQDELAPARR